MLNRIHNVINALHSEILVVCGTSNRQYPPELFNETMSILNDIDELRKKVAAMPEAQQKYMSQAATNFLNPEKNADSRGLPPG